jgi:hypothetical protein
MPSLRHAHRPDTGGGLARPLDSGSPRCRPSWGRRARPDSSSGGAVSPPLLPAPFAFISQWLPSGATVTALRDAIYFPGYQHARPILVVAAWSATLFAAMVAASRRLGTSPGGG